MKRILAVMMASILSLSLVACSNTTPNDDTNTPDDTNNVGEVDTTADDIASTITPDSAEAKGICGSDMQWYYQEGILLIKGTGDMNDYSFDSAPWNGNDISWVIIDEGIESIGQAAFYSLPQLNRATLPDTLLTIGSDAFKFCNNLREITIPQNVTNTNNGAGLIDCSNLSSVTFKGDMPEGAENIVWRAKTVIYSGDSYNDLIEKCNTSGQEIEWIKQ